MPSDNMKKQFNVKRGNFPERVRILQVADSHQILLNNYRGGRNRARTYDLCDVNAVL
jgi:hypothetical protein